MRAKLASLATCEIHRIIARCQNTLPTIVSCAPRRMAFGSKLDIVFYDLARMSPPKNSSRSEKLLSLG